MKWFVRLVTISRRFDLGILIFGGILILFGLSIIYSIGLHGETVSLGKFYRQLFAIGVGILFFVGIVSIDFRFLQHVAWFVYAAGGCLLLSVLLFGTTYNGTTGWLNLGVIIVQPVEIAKVMFVVALAAWVARREGRIDTLQKLIGSLSLVGVYMVLVLLQPDLGSAMVFIGIWFFMLLTIKTKNTYRIAIIILGLVVITMGWFLLSGYQKDRILVFLNPEASPLGAGYNVTQSMVAVGSGKIFGRGLGLGPQSQLNFLPEQETDFIFAVVAEELGFLGTAILLLSLGCLWFFMWRRAQYTKDSFGKYVLIFGMFQLFIQTFVNIGMNIGIMPVTGIPLPFVSSGGSSLVSSILLLGIMENIALRSEQAPKHL